MTRVGSWLPSFVRNTRLKLLCRWMIGFSAIYIVSALFLYQSGFGDSSLVYANIVNLTARIIYALRFISNFFNSSTTKGSIFHWQAALIPSPSLFVVSALSASSIWLSERAFKPNDLAIGRRGLFHPAMLLHVGIGGVLGLISLGVWWMKDGKHLELGNRFRRSKVD